MNKNISYQCLNAKHFLFILIFILLKSVPTIIITPTTILTRPHESFQFECKSVMPGGEPKITLEGYPVENDPRFTIVRPSREHVIVRAESGIADPGKYSFTYENIVYN